LIKQNEQEFFNFLRHIILKKQKNCLFELTNWGISALPGYAYGRWCHCVLHCYGGL